MPSQWKIGIHSSWAGFWRDLVRSEAGTFGYGPASLRRLTFIGPGNLQDGFKVVVSICVLLPRLPMIRVGVLFVKMIMCPLFLLIWSEARDNTFIESVLIDVYFFNNE
ncbi:hypothetical protein M426DRAFT_20983 [Hypoxylon sp. CI-4A]|nr:hypothetical protein M426DRAFT_20983 [Hypoxylon sp. CI-4A]